MTRPGSRFALRSGALIVLAFELAIAPALARSQGDAPNSRISRPIGVPVEKKLLYDTTLETFRCLDNSAVIPFEHINDDYCDCRDGSDEPGTSACPNGIFHCENRGFLPSRIPTSRVNDGFCDCCDGSDEYQGKIQCDNTCLELGAKMREEQEKRSALLREGSEKRRQYINDAVAARQTKQTELDTAEAALAAIEARKSEAEATKKTAEDLEREAKDKHNDAWKERKEERQREQQKLESAAAFERLDTNADGRLTGDELRAGLALDDMSIYSDSEQGFIAAIPEQYDDADVFYIAAWTVVKQLLQTGSHEKERAMEEPSEDAPIVTPPASDDFAEEDDVPADVEGDDEEQFAEFPSEQEDERAGEEEFGLTDEDDHDEDSSEPTRDSDDEPAYDEATRQLVEAADKARNEFREIESEEHATGDSISRLKRWLETDFGPDEAFAGLFDECLEFTDREYIYKLCFFDTVSQRGRNGGSEVQLGRWGHWMGEDEAGGGAPYTRQLYDAGTRCWNGPDRNTEVTIECGIENKLLSASEPSRCTYAMHLSTPAACVELSAGNDVPPPDDDLLRHMEL